MARSVSLREPEREWASVSRRRPKIKLQLTAATIERRSRPEGASRVLRWVESRDRRIAPDINGILERSRRRISHVLGQGFDAVEVVQDFKEKLREEAG